VRQKEIIRLDARVVGVIADAVFRARLANGHEIVAWAGREERRGVQDLRQGDVVSVEMSPFDMSKGRIVLGENQRQT
jgi:translation initiation factor IF-1